MPPFLTLLALVATAPTALAYPLDGTGYTGIQRLEGYRLAQQGNVRGRALPPGALLDLDQVRPGLLDYPELTIPEPDPELERELRSMLVGDPERWGVAVLDVSDPRQPVYAEHRAGASFNPGSVGKLAVALALFHGLAEAWPEKAERERMLRNTEVVADAFIRYDHHDVPFWDPDAGRLNHRPLRQGDGGNLWTWLDWMLSASSNAAASMVLKQALLLHRFGRDYPPSREATERFFEDTSRDELSHLLDKTVRSGLAAAGLDPRRFYQGGFFTSGARKRVPGKVSYATPRELIRLLLRMEQGRLIDRFTSRELKRLIYMTQKRIRYASSPALRGAAVYFKSGSLYRCRPEDGFDCGKYRGNALNLLNSVALVEAPAREPRLRYLVAVTSNVPKKNASVAHQSLGTWLHRLIQRRHAPAGSDH